MSYKFIDASKADYPVSRLCRLLSVSQSGYHAWKGRTMSPQRRRDMVLSVHMRAAFRLSHETYGSPRMAQELRAQGFAVGRRRVCPADARKRPEGPSEAPLCPHD